MRKQTIFLVCALLCLLALTGCNLNFNTTVNGDGTGRMSIEIGYTTEEAEDWWGEEDLSSNFCEDLWYEEDLAEELPPGATIRVEPRGDQIWCIVSFDFYDLEELEEVYDYTFNMYVDRLEIENENFYLDLTWDLEGLQDESSYPIEAVFRVTMPGTVSSTNADVRSGRTLTWNLDEDGENVIRAVSSTKSSDWVWWLIGSLCCLCLGVLVAAGIVALVVYLRKKNS